MEVQSILIPRNKFNLKQANKFIKDNDYKLTYYKKKVHITDNYFRFRQKKPNKNKNYKIKKLKNGIKLILIF